MKMEELCPLCDGNLTTGCVVSVKRGLPAMIRASERLEDVKWTLWKDRQTARVQYMKILGKNTQVKIQLKPK